MAAITSVQFMQMQKTARDFEAMFVSRMLESATSGLSTKGTFFGGSGEAQFRSLLNEQYGKQVAQHGGLGIAEAVLREMVRLQEAQP